MAVLTPTSVYYDHQATAPVANKNVLVIPFHYVNLVDPGTAGSVQLIRLPAGKIRIIETQSFVTVEDTTATTTLSVGHAAYIDGLTGLAVAADVDAFRAAALISGPITAGVFANTVSAAANQHRLNSKAGINLTVSTLVSTMAVSKYVKGHITIILEGD
jgi:hypothetical protein